MAAKRRLGDRREHLRFEVAGQLWASLDMKDRVVLKNIGVGGALIEATLGPGMRSIRAAQIALRERGPEVNVLVRHITPISASPTEDRFLMGLEFVNLSSSARADIDRLVQEWGDRPGR